MHRQHSNTSKPAGTSLGVSDCKNSSSPKILNISLIAYGVRSNTRPRREPSAHERQMKPMKFGEDRQAPLQQCRQNVREEFGSRHVACGHNMSASRSCKLGLFKFKLQPLQNVFAESNQITRNAGKYEPRCVVFLRATQPIMIRPLWNARIDN